MPQIHVLPFIPLDGALEVNLSGLHGGGGGSHTLFFQVNTINGRQQPEVVGGKGVRLIIYI